MKVVYANVLREKADVWDFNVEYVGLTKKLKFFFSSIIQVAVYISIL